MKNQSKIQEVATSLLSSISATSATVWTKKGNRLYINGVGYNTNKCKQSVYIDLDTFSVVCFTDCPSQDFKWIKSQNAKVMNDERLNAFARLLRIVDNKVN